MSRPRLLNPLEPTRTGLEETVDELDWDKAQGAEDETDDRSYYS